MSRRNWTPDEKLQIVLEGLKESISLSELCNRYQISQTQYYQWKDRLIGEGSKVFERGGVDKKAQKLEAENRKLKTIIGDLTVELKKNEF